jgi:hypothetical protein
VISQEPEQEGCVTSRDFREVACRTVGTVQLRRKAMSRKNPRVHSEMPKKFDVVCAPRVFQIRDPGSDFLVMRHQPLVFISWVPHPNVALFDVRVGFH